ncbi:MAG: helix-turn-helix domain-containing protein [Gammaproteobacteria bacterium]|nr:helix-turn-helix domain-containing protein [Gammaproteobacteria bacterium]
MGHQQNVVRIRRAAGNCEDCQSQGLCLAAWLDTAEAQDLDEAVLKRRNYQAGEAIAYQGDAAETLISVRTGAVKHVNTDAGGRQQITGFSMPGDIIGFSSLPEGQRRDDLLAIESTSVCVLPYSTCVTQGAGSENMVNALVMGAEAESANVRLRCSLLAEPDADTRLLRFFHWLGRKQAARGLSPRHIRLPMARQDIAAFLCLAVETVSRVFRRLDERGVIRADQREIELLDAAFDDIDDSNLCA